MKILNANDQYLVKNAGGYRSYMERKVFERWGKPAPLGFWDVGGEAITAFVINSSWAIQCPVCKELFVAQIGEPFPCPNCGSAARNVIFPENKDAIEVVLLARPDPRTRAWVPGETVDDLIAENIQHGLEA